MNKGIAALHRGQTTRSTRDGGIDTSPSQDRHWKWMLAFTKPLVVVLLVSAGLQAQSIADVARRERERQANLRSARVVAPTGAITNVEEPAAPTEAGPAESKPAVQDRKQTPKPSSAVDPAETWNKEVDQLRAKIRLLQSQELDLLRQLNDTTNQVYAPVTDPATHDRAQAQLADIQKKLEDVRKELADAGKKLADMQLQGPPKK